MTPYTSAIWAGVTVSFVLGGCGLLDLPTPPLPPEVAFAVDNKEMFVERDDGPLIDVDPGTVIDDLSELSGCWGVYRPGLTLFGETLGGVFFIQMFDVESGSFTGWFLTDQLGVQILSGGRGELEIVNDGRIALTTTERFSPFAEDGELNPNATFSVDENALTTESTVTLSGNQLSIDDLPDEEEPEPVDIITYTNIYTRFDCPDASAGGGE